MGTQKRERQKANRAKRLAEEARAAKTDAVKRNVLRWVVGGILAFGAVLLIAWLGGAFDGDDTEPEIAPTPAVSLSPDVSLPVTIPGSLPAGTQPTPTSAP